jgi:hypothetical protein
VKAGPRLLRFEYNVLMGETLLSLFPPCIISSYQMQNKFALNGGALKLKIKLKL